MMIWLLLVSAYFQTELLFVDLISLPRWLATILLMSEYQAMMVVVSVKRPSRTWMLKKFRV